MKARKLLPLFILLLLVSFHAVNNYSWLREDLVLRESGFIYHNMRLNIYDILRHPSADMVASIFRIGGFYPPFFLFSAAVVNLFFGPSLLVSAMTNMIYFALLLFSVYKIGAKIDSQITGILAAGIVSLYPGIFGSSRLFGLMFALCSLVSFSIYCLLYSDIFRNRKYSILFGLSIGLGMLTKWTFAFFIFGPLLFVLAQTVFFNIRQIPRDRMMGGVFRSLAVFLRSAKQQLLNIFYTFLFAFTIAGVYYLKFLRTGDLFKSFPEESAGMLWYELRNIFFYIFDLININLSFFFFMLFLCAFAGVVIFWPKLQKKGILILWILIPYIIFTFFRANKNSRYIISFLPAIAIISASGLVRIRNKILRVSIIVFVILIGLIQYCDLSFGLGVIPGDLSIHMPFGRINVFYEPDGGYKKIYCGPPNREGIRTDITDEMVTCMREYSGKSMDKVFFVLDPFANSYLGVEMWRYLIRDRRLPVELREINPQLLNFVNIYIETLDNIDFWITDNDIKDKDYLDFFRNELAAFDPSYNIDNRIITEKEAALFNAVIADFRLVKQIPINDYENIYIYENMKVRF